MITPSDAAGVMHDPVPMIKAHFIEAETPAKSAALPSDADEKIFGKHNAIQPPQDPLTLAKIVEYSSGVRQCIDAYCTNIDAQGHRFEPILHVDSADMTGEIEDLLEQQWGRAPTPLEIDIKREEIRKEMVREERRLKNFFKYCAGKVSFVTLRTRLRRDLETMGNAYMEVLRNGDDEISRFERIPAQTVRLLPSDFVDTEVEHRCSIFDTDTVLENREYRKYMQVVGSRTVFFKDFGDPRVISRKDGHVFETELDLYTRDPKDQPANELVHFKIDSPRSPYGMPRWIGVLLEVVGNRLASEVNMLYFDNKSIPPLALLVSGGKFTAETVNRIRDYIQNSLKGTKNFHKIMVLEAEGAVDNRIENTERFANTGRVKIELKPLTEAMQKDGLFLQYTQQNLDIIGMAFRLPKLLRGDIRDFNRGTADAALNFTEQQVFQPIRNEFDKAINDILFSMGFRYWEFFSNAPIVRDPSQMAEIIYKLMSCGAIIPKEGRVLAGDVFNKQFSELTAKWTLQPLLLSQQGLPVEPEAGTAAANALNEQIGAGIQESPDNRQPGSMSQTFTAEASGTTAQSVPNPEVVSVPQNVWYNWGIEVDPQDTEQDEDKDDYEP
jgi:PBSX family phage portal protein